MSERSQASAWRQRAEKAMVTGRSQEWYDKVFDIQQDERVLDLGSGHSKYAHPNMTRADYHYHTHRHEEPIEQGVACLFQDLPFPDEAFDRTVASYSFFWLKGGTGQSLEEMLRVTRPGGAAQLVPGRRRYWNRGQAKGFAAEHNLGLRNMRFPDLAISAPGSLAGGVAEGISIRGEGLGVITSVGSIVLGEVATGAVGYAASRLAGKILPLHTITVPRTEAMSDPDYRTEFVKGLMTNYVISRGLQDFVPGRGQAYDT